MGPSWQLWTAQSSLSILPVKCCLPMSFMVPCFHISSGWSVLTSQYLECSCHCMGAERQQVVYTPPPEQSARQQGIHRADLLFPEVSKDTRGFETNPSDS